MSFKKKIINEILLHFYAFPALATITEIVFDLFDNQNSLKLIPLTLLCFKFKQITTKYSNT